MRIISAEDFIREVNLGQDMRGYHHDGPAIQSSDARQVFRNPCAYHMYCDALLPDRDQAAYLRAIHERDRHQISINDALIRARLALDRNPDFIHPHNLPKAKPTMTPQERITAAQFETEKALKEIAETEKRDALKARLEYHAKLASATSTLINTAGSLLISGSVTSSPCPGFATFRKELQPLAESYGLKIVLVGDKTMATLVVA